MENKQVVDQRTKKKYYYLTDIHSSAVYEKVFALPDVVQYKDGFLIPLIPQNNKVVRELATQDGSYIAKEKANQKQIEYQKFLNERGSDYAFAEEMLRCIHENKPIQGSPGSSPLLMNHQKAGSAIAERFDKYAFFYDTGTGKTLMALDIIRRKSELKNAHFLILCPKTIINTAWMDDASRFYPQLRILPLSNNTTAEQLRKLLWQWRKNDPDFFYPQCFFEKRKKDREEQSREYMLSQADHLIVNYELFTRNPDKYMRIISENRSVGIDGIIVDESSVLKSGYSCLYDNLCWMLNDYKVKYLYLFSGKPAPNKLMEYQPQIKLVAPDLMLPSVSTLSKSLLRYESELMYAIKKSSITVTKKDCFDLPETTEVIRKVALTPSLRRAYSGLAARVVTELQDIEKEKSQNHIVYFNQVLTSIMKLRQFTGGFVRDEENVIHVHSQKLEELKSVVEELGGQQAIIWCQFTREIDEITRMLTDLGYSVVTAYGKTKDKDASINSFKNGDATFLVAHPRTLQYGVTLTNCCYAIYYSTSYSFEEYYQSHDRIYRKGQTLPCTYIFIQVENTIDEIMFDVITRKKNGSEMIEMVLRHLHESKAKSL